MKTCGQCGFFEQSDPDANTRVNGKRVAAGTCNQKPPTCQGFAFPIQSVGGTSINFQRLTMRPDVQAKDLACAEFWEMEGERAVPTVSTPTTILPANE